MARRKPPTIHGLAVVDKPAGVTSHDVVGMMRRRLGERQVGHAGTLDPDATGVLLVGVGNGDPAAAVPDRARQDVHGRGGAGHRDVDARLRRRGHRHARHVGRHRRQARVVVAEHLIGPIMQVPPMVSALKVDGRRLHELAREGIEVERQPRPVTVHSFDVDATDDPLGLRHRGRSARRARTSARWPPTWAVCWAAARICATCGARRSAASPRARRGRPTSPSCSRRRRRCATTARSPSTTERPTWCATAACSTAWDGDGPWAVVDGHGALLAVYERSATTAKPAVVVAVSDFVGHARSGG